MSVDEIGAARAAAPSPPGGAGSAAGPSARAFLEAAPVRYRDRESGKIETEPFSTGALPLLYGNRLGGLLAKLLAFHPAPSHLYGWLQRLPGSRSKIPGFVASLGIDAAEAERPLAEYGSLDDFFTRRLRPGARPIDPDPDHLVSPADGRVLALPRLDGGAISVKRSRVTLDELVGDAALARRYQGGAGFVVRLAPGDYHRFHFPDGGEALPPRALGRRLHSVHTVALAAGAPSFRNKRVVTVLASRGFGDLLLVEIGALTVGSIVETYRPGPVERGEEKGYFRFGGSTVLVLAEPGRVLPDPDLLEASAGGGAAGEIETLVKMGTRIGRRA